MPKGAYGSWPDYVRSWNWDGGQSGVRVAETPTSYIYHLQGVEEWHLERVLRGDQTLLLSNDWPGWLALVPHVVDIRWERGGIVLETTKPAEEYLATIPDLLKWSVEIFHGEARCTTKRWRRPPTISEWQEVMAARVEAIAEAEKQRGFRFKYAPRLREWFERYKALGFHSLYN